MSRMYRIFHVPCLIVVTIVVNFARFMLALHDFWETNSFCRQLEHEVKFFVAKVLPQVLKASALFTLLAPFIIGFMIMMVKLSN